MHTKNQYAMLMCSLPYCGTLFDTKQPPISRLKLDRRLKSLASEDHKTLAMIEELLQWDHIDSNQSDTQLIGRAHRIVSHLDDKVLQRIVTTRMEQRTLVAALRRRSRGESNTARAGDLGFGRWTGHVCRNWQVPAFGLGRTFPWLKEAEQKLVDNDALGLERVLLQVVWAELNNLSRGHYFDFVAVVSYVLRWNLVDRWTRYDSDRASLRFNDALKISMGKYVAIFSGVHS